MKRILRMLGVIALTGAALLYTGCTKDYSGDVSALQEEQAKQATQIATQATQIADLKTYSENLNKNLTDLQKSFETAKAAWEKAKGELEAADKTNAENIAKLEKRVTTLEGTVTTISTQISNVQDKIASIKETISKLQDALDGKASKDEFGKLQEVVEKHLTAYGEMKGQVEKIQIKVDSLGNVDDLLASLADVIYQADTTAAGLTKIFGEISVVKNYLYALYTNEEINVLLGAKADTTEVNALTERLEAVESLLVDQKKPVSEVIKALQAMDDTLAGRIDKLNDKIDSLITKEVQDRDAAITTALNNFYTTYIEPLKARVEEIASRVTSISVYPTGGYEIFSMQVGTGETAVYDTIFVAKFEVEPKSAAKSITADQITINLKEGLARGSVTPIDVRVPATKVYADEANGVITVIANTGVKATLSSSTKKEYFAITYAGKDYTVTSDYAAAVKSENDPIDVTTSFHPGEDDTKVVQGDIENVVTNDYFTFYGKKYTPFEKCSIVNFQIAGVESQDEKLNEALWTLFNREETENPVVSSKVFAAETNISLAFTYDVDTVDTKVYPFAVEKKSIKPAYEYLSDVQFIVKGAPENSKDTLKNYINGSPWIVNMYINVNGAQLPQKYIQKYDITKVQHKDFKTIEFYLPWNYKTYMPEDRIAKINDPAVLNTYVGPTCLQSGKQMTWDEVIKSTTQQDASTFRHDHTCEYGYIQYIDRKEQGAVVKDSVKVVGDDNDNFKKASAKTLYNIRANDTDEYYIPVKTTVDATPEFKTEYFTYEEVPGTVTKPITVAYVGFVKQMVHNNLDVLKSGLKDVTEQEIYEDAISRVNYILYSQNYQIQWTANQDTEMLKAKGIADKCNVSLRIGVNGGQYENDTLVIEIKPTADLLNYNTTYTVSLDVYRDKQSFYNINYPARLDFKTGAPKFKLVTKPWIVNGVGKANGKIDEAGYFGIKDLDYNKQVEVVYDDPNEIDQAKYYVQFSYVKATKDATGEPSVTDKLLKVNNGTGAIGAYEPMTWGTYNGLNIGMLAQLYVTNADSTIVKAVNVDQTVYNIVTDKPVEFVNEGVIEAKKKAGKQLNIPVYEKLKVYGIKEGTIDRTVNIMYNGVNQSPRCIYGTAAQGGKTEYVYGTDIKVTLEGSSEPLVKGVDWDFEQYFVDPDVTPAAERATFIVKKDNLVGNLNVEIPVTLNYYLDINHTAAEKSVIKITVTQATE